MLYIITAVHNRYDITKLFVDNLKKQNNQAFTLVLVDDGSTDGTADMVIEALPHSIILKGDGNLWWGGALHKAYKYLSNGIVKDTDNILICNDDIEFDKSFLDDGIEKISENNHCLILSKAVDRIDGSLVSKACKRNPITADMIPIDFGQKGNCGSTRAAFMSGKAYVNIGGMHPILLPHYCSDVEYVMRAARKGYPCVTYERPVCRVNNETTGINKSTSIKQTFSKRYMNNPIYKLNYILLITPFYLLPAYIFSLCLRRFRKK